MYYYENISHEESIDTGSHVPIPFLYKVGQTQNSHSIIC